MIEWWGFIIFEYYGVIEGFGFVVFDSYEWLVNRGSVGKIFMGELYVLDEDGNLCLEGKLGELWFKCVSEFFYFNDMVKIKEFIFQDGMMSIVGDVGYVKDGYFYLMDCFMFMIILGGVNIYF